MAVRHAIRILAWAIAGAGLLGIPAAQAQRGERGGFRSQAAPFVQERGAYRGRGQDLYSARPGYGGTITASTPNESGNLGGPGTGGGGGGGGGR